MPLVKIYWRIFKPVTFGVKAIILCDNEVLLVKNVSESKWHLPGGGIYKSESSYEAVRREVKEELNFDIESYYKINETNLKHKENFINIKNDVEAKFDSNILGTYISNLEGKRDTIYVYVFKLSSKPKFEVNKIELLDARWFAINKLINTKKENTNTSNEVKNKNNLEIEISPAMIRRLREYIDGQGYTEKFKVW